MTVVIPDSVVAAGNVKALWVPAIAVTTAPTVAELTATGVVDISCYLMDGWAGVTVDQNTGESRRFCSTEGEQSLGYKSYTIADLVYTYLPQGTSSVAGNKVYAALVENTTGFLVVRYGLAVATAIAATQKVDVIGAQVGVRSKATTGSDEFAPLTISQKIVKKGTVQADVAVAA